MCSSLHNGTNPLVFVLPIGTFGRGYYPRWDLWTRVLPALYRIRAKNDIFWYVAWCVHNFFTNPSTTFWITSQLWVLYGLNHFNVNVWSRKIKNVFNFFRFNGFECFLKQNLNFVLEFDFHFKFDVDEFMRGHMNVNGLLTLFEWLYSDCTQTVPTYTSWCTSD